MSARYFSSISLKAGIVVDLDEAESHHLLHVMRAEVGQEVCLFDGGPNEFAGRVVSKNRKQVRVEVLDCLRTELPAKTSILVAAPIPKGDRFRFLIEKLTELGAAAFLPLRTLRSVNPITASLLKKAEQWMIEACKQSGRNQMLQILEPVDLATLLVTDRTPVRWVACAPHDQLENSGQIEVSGAAFAIIPSLIIDEVAEREPPSIRTHSTFDSILVVGPEGGLTADELESLGKQAFRPLVVGNYILRMETATIAAVAILLGNGSAMASPCDRMSG